MGKKILVPYIDGDDLKLSVLKEMDSDLEPGNFGVLEPTGDSLRPVSTEEADLIIVPGLAFDREGNRIGYGGGYYDNLLKKTNEDARFIALAYEFQITNRVPHDEKDVPVHRILTEKRIITNSDILEDDEEDEQ